MALESYRYKVTLSYIHFGYEIAIDPQQIQYVGIDRTFDSNNMPVIAVNCNIERDILDMMIQNTNENIVELGVFRYDASNQNDNITKKYFHDRFIYFLGDDISQTAEIDYGNGQEHTREKYKEVTMWLIQQDAVNNNRKVINGIFKNATTNSLILQITDYVGNTVLEPVDYDNKYDQIIIPPTNSIAQYIAFLNNNLSVFYDTGYRFFIDFDMTYIVSSKGKPIQTKNQNIFTVEINVTNIIPDEDSESGMVVDARNGKYIMDVPLANINFTKNNVTNKMVNKITTIDSSGNVKEKLIEGNDTNVTTMMNKIVNLSNNDQNAINSITADYELNNVFLSITKNDLDASIFTMNKEYIITMDEDHEEYSGRYLLSAVKQFFVKQNEYFVMTTILMFKKI